MKRPAFTMIELLVVIAVIAILIGIALPAMSMAKERGRTVVCRSNIRQQHLAMYIYENSNGSFPTGFDYRPNVAIALLQSDNYIGIPADDWIGKWWFQFLDIGDDSESSPLWCPSSRVKSQGAKKLVLCGNYGVNRAICKNPKSASGVFEGKPLSSTNIPQSSKTILLLDSGYTLMSWQGGSDCGSGYYETPKRQDRFYIPGMNENQNRVISPYALDDALEGRHGSKRINIAFVDGHTEYIPAEDIFAKKQSDGTYTNQKTLWQPE